MATDEERIEAEIEERRRLGEQPLGEWFLLSPNRFSPSRSGTDVLLLGLMTFLCLPLGPLALVRAVRSADQHRRAGGPVPRAVPVGAGLAVAGTALQIWLLARLLLR